MKRFTAAALFCTGALALASEAVAQEETPEWTGEGSFGAGVTSGNTDTKDLSAGLKLKHNGPVWAQSGELAAEYGETDGVETKNRVAGALQVDRSFTPRLSAFGRLTYEKDEFSGFEDRTFAGLGVAYKVIVSEPTSWTLQGGPGYRQDKIRTTGETEESLGATLGSRFKHAFNERVALTNDTDITTGDVSTQVVNGLALTFEIMGNLSARVSYDVRHDTSPPAGFEKTDTATRFSLVYKIG
ncbi:MAG: DUF481 domain-containing protein [Hyphomonadaceae bacterium]